MRLCARNSIRMIAPAAIWIGCALSASGTFAQQGAMNSPGGARGYAEALQRLEAARKEVGGGPANTAPSPYAGPSPPSYAPPPSVQQTAPVIARPAASPFPPPLQRPVGTPPFTTAQPMQTPALPRPSSPPTTTAAPAMNGPVTAEMLYPTLNPRPGGSTPTRPMPTRPASATPAATVSVLRAPAERPPSSAPEVVPPSRNLAPSMQPAPRPNIAPPAFPAGPALVRPTEDEDLIQDRKFPKLEDGFQFRPPHEPATDPCAAPAPYSDQDFAPTQYHAESPYDAREETAPYGDKKLLRVQRPWVEWFRPLYDTGPIPRAPEIFGPTNVFTPQFLVYGDYRAAAAYVDNGGGAQVGKIANRLNLEMDLKLTATERVHGFIDPFTNGNTFTSVVVGDNNIDFVDGLNAQFQTLFFEGDLGAMTGGGLGIDPPFDMPFTIGRVPLLFQNGIWMEDAILGAAVAIPARNSPFLDWSNYDLTFFAGIDELNSPAFADNSAASVFGTHAFIEAYGGYIEFGYAYLDDKFDPRFNYHNIGLSYQRRYFNLVSNAVRCIVNTGQDNTAGLQTADGVLLLCENVFITDNPYFKLPYANFFAGFDRPQSVARAAGAQGVLRNTGINFESDNLTNYPTLDASANNTWGGAIGLDLLASDLTQQFIVELAFLQTMGDDVTRIAKGNQYALGTRWQKPLNNSWILRADAMYGLRDNAGDVAGARMELRHKF